MPYQLLEILKERSIKRGEFKLASGDTSNYFIDCKSASVYSFGAYLIGEAIYDKIRNIKIDSIGGDIGATPLIVSTLISYCCHGRIMEGFRLEDDNIIGNIKKGDKVAVVDDVYTRGSSINKVISAVRNFGCEVISVIVLVDRLVNPDKPDNFQSIFTINDLGV